jgi:Rrf2 family nitric oxide-sensitive transcriptional repressor
MRAGGNVIFSRKTDYGLRALMYLAGKPGAGPVTLHEIAEKLAIPQAFLSKILQQLAHKGIVRSVKGPSGGFVLAADPAKLTMHEIVTEIDGHARVFECFGEEADCSFFDDCMIRDVFDEVEQKIGQVLSQYTLADFQRRTAGKA